MPKKANYNVFVRPSAKTGMLQVRAKISGRTRRFYMTEQYHDLVYSYLEDKLMFPVNAVVLG